VDFTAENEDIIKKNMSLIKELIHNAGVVYDNTYRLQKKFPTQDVSGNRSRVQTITDQLRKQNITIKGLYC
jgi:hypothetical protein